MRPRWVVLVAAALLVGAIAATAAFLATGRQGPPRHRYQVSVFLTSAVTDEQRAALKSALSALHPVDGVQYESRADAWRKFQEQFKDSPDLVAATRPDSLPESLRLTTSGAAFDCRRFAPVERMSGVESTVILQLPEKGSPGAPVYCSQRAR